MELNADFTARAVVHSEKIEWLASPMKGVSRRMLDRIGDEVARATTIVRYDPGSHFSAHTHAGGEEFIVLEGVFQDEHGDFPAGSYVRNPPTSSHTPRSDDGCVIFVKLWQFDMADRTHVNIDMGKGVFTPAEGRSGVEVMQLFQDSRETVELERWAAGASITFETDGGAELLVLDGSFEESGETFSKSSVSKLYAWAADRSGKAGPRRCLFGHADEMKPVQIPVQILRSDAAIATQEILQLAVATVDRLDVKGIPDPLSGRKLERLVANAHGGSAGPITAFAVGDENDIGVHRRFEDSFQRVRVDRRKNFADRRAAAVGSDQNRNLLM